MDESLSIEATSILQRNTVDISVSRNNKKYNVKYTAPSPGIYSQQWFWDSCLHSLVWEHLGKADRAVQELESLVIGKGEREFFPHMLFWRNIKNVYWWIFDRLYPSKKYSELIQPPIIGFSLSKIYQKEIGNSILETLINETLKYYRYILEVRDPEKSNLITIIHPWESGLDSSPKFDLHLTNSHFMRIKQWYRMYSLLKEFSKIDWDQQKMSEEGSFRVKCVLTNTLLAWGLSSFSNLLKELNYKEEAFEMNCRAEQVKESLIQNCWNEKEGLFFDLNMNSVNEKQIEVKTITSLIPIMLDIPKDIKERILEHLINPKEFWSTYPIPTVSMDEKSFNPKDIKLLWRGPTWININYFIWEGLLKHKETKIAKELANKTLELIKKSGFREFYNPITGEGGGAKDFGWSTLILLMKG